MAKVSFIFVAIALITGNVLCQSDATYAVSSNAPGYKINGDVKHTEAGLHIPLTLNSLGNKKTGINTFGKTIKDITVDVEYETEERLHVKISDKAKKQYLVPDSPLGFERPQIKHYVSPKNSNLDFQYTAKPFSFKVVRKSDKTTIFDTSNLPLVFEDQYLELSTKVPKDANIYGFGEVTAPFLRSTNVTTLWARDNADDFYRNVYGAHPYYQEVRDGKAHGALLMSSHGMDVVTTEGRITYKVIGGVFDFYFFAPKSGKPNDLSIAYTDLIGKPMMPSHWMLGWHHCRYGYSNISAPETVKRKYKEANIPLQTLWVDIDYMDQTKDFTFDNVKFPQDKMIALGEQLHKDGQNYVVMVDPAISANTTYEPYVRGTDMNVWIKNADGSDYIGQVWPGYTTFPDWWHPNATEYWTKEIVDWVNLLGVDGLWIDMNEPASFCLGSCGTGKIDAGNQPYRWTLPQEEQDKNHALQEAALKKMGNPPGEERNLLYPKYAINNGGGNLSELTVATTALHYGDIPHYDIHNLYGHAEGHITRNALIKQNKKVRPFVLTRSSFVGSGKNVGHWTGDNHSLWAYLKNSIANVLNFQMFGITYSGADVCGFNQATTEEMCTRWMEIGAFYPFARNHNAIGEPDQEPYLWESTAEGSRNALSVRYEMLPYFYTLFEESNRLGLGVWRPLFFEYPAYEELSANDLQTMVGSDILLSPVLDEGKTSVEAQFPGGQWYDWYTHELTVDNKSNKKVKTVTLDAPLTHIPIHIRGGAIVPTKTPKYTVGETFATPYNLVIALDKKGEASGRLYIDDGESLNVKSSSDITFTYKNGHLKASGKFGYKKAEKIGSITIIGKHASKLQKAQVGKKTAKLTHGKNDVTLEGVSIDLSKSFSIEFK
ncbi:glycoside hydrolase family 31 protein [Mucor lusitanicus]|uniref:Maltase n=2 Tax=Mucor circinelloides f. lusitanicus TaxID=29924 RepID=A0A168HMA1_MUCCL|nr:glycoside hydrolase family 31 protein [Mucor lusitanicus]OAC98955.1 glycoside hydrolase family 31 protein [Mucor lusitanicus CBS 277.49]